MRDSGRFPGISCRKELSIFLILLAAAGALTWLPTWNEPYAEDDYLFLEAVSRPDAPEPIGWFFGEGVMDHHYRPLSDPLFFWLLRRISGLHPAGYHVIFFLCHIAAAFLAARIGLALGLDRAAAALAGTIYVTRDFIFPSMVWASGFSDIGSTLFSLASTAIFLRWTDSGRARDLALSVFFFTLAILIKETAVVTLGLHALVFAYRRKGHWLRAAPGALWPFVLVGVPLAFLQFSMARFEEGYGKTLYSLSLGRYAFEVWPAYLIWCVAGVREIVAWKGLYLYIVAAVYGLTAALGIWTFKSRAGRQGAGFSSCGAGAILLAAGWFTIAISPALLAPGRVLTNYLAIAAVGPCIWLGSALLTAARSKRPELRACGIALIATVLLSGPVIVWLKDAGKLDTGGWVDLERSRKMERAVIDVQKALPHPAPGARILIFGGLDIDLRVLGNPRGAGFGQQHVLASAARVRYGRYDIDIVPLPRAEEAAPAVIIEMVRLLNAGPASTYILTSSDAVRDVTAYVADAIRRGGGVSEVRRALLGQAPLYPSGPVESP